MLRITAGLVIVFCGLIAAAIGVGSRAELPPIMLSDMVHGTFKVTFVDPNRNRTIRLKRPRPDGLDRLDIATETTFTTSDGATSFYIRHEDPWARPYGELTVTHMGLATQPLEDWVHGVPQFHSPDERFWYFFSVWLPEANWDGTLIRYDLETSQTKTILQNTTGTYHCSNVYPNWCVIYTQDDEGSGSTYMLNLYNGMIRMVADDVHLSGWLKKSGKYIYSTHDYGSGSTIILYDPEQDNHSLIYETPDSIDAIDWYEDEHHVVVSTSLHGSRESETSDIVIIQYGHGENAERSTTSIRNVYPDIQIDSGNYSWMPISETLAFLEFRDERTSLSLFSEPEKTIFPLTEFEDGFVRSFDTSRDETWISIIALNRGQLVLYVIPVDSHLPPRILDSATITNESTKLEGWMETEQGFE